MSSGLFVGTRVHASMCHWRPMLKPKYASMSIICVCMHVYVRMCTDFSLAYGYLCMLELSSREYISSQVRASVCMYVSA